MMENTNGQIYLMEYRRVPSLGQSYLRLTSGVVSDTKLSRGSAFQDDYREIREITINQQLDQKNDMKFEDHIAV